MGRSIVPSEQIPYLLGQVVISQYFGPPYFYLAFTGFALAFAIRLTPARYASACQL